MLCRLGRGRRIKQDVQDEKDKMLVFYPVRICILDILLILWKFPQVIFYDHRSSKNGSRAAGSGRF